MKPVGDLVLPCNTYRMLVFIAPWVLAIFSAQDLCPSLWHVVEVTKMRDKQLVG